LFAPVVAPDLNRGLSAFSGWRRRRMPGQARHRDASWPRLPGVHLSPFPGAGVAFCLCKATPPPAKETNPEFRRWRRR